MSDSAGDDFASFASTGVVDLGHDDGEESANYLNWAPPESGDTTAVGDFGDFSSFAADSSGATFDFDAVDFASAIGATEGDLKVSAEDLAASGLDMEWAQKIGLSADEVASADDTDRQHVGSLEFGGADESQQTQLNDLNQFKSGTADFGDFGGTDFTTETSADFGDFSAFSGADSASESPSFSADNDTTVTVNSEAPVDVAAANSASADVVASASFGDSDNNVAPTMKDMSFASFDSEPIAVAPGSDSTAFDTGAFSSVAETGYSNDSLQTSTSAGDDWGDFESSGAAGAAEFAVGGNDGAGTDSFADFGTAPSSDDFGDFSATRGGVDEDFSADFGDFDSAKVTTEGASESFGDFGSFNEPKGLDSDGFADFGSSTTPQSVDSAFGSFEGSTEVTDGFGSFSEPTAAEGGGWGSFPPTSTPLPQGTSLFAASVSLVDMDDITFRREVSSVLESVFGAGDKASGTSADPPPSLRILLTTGPDGSGRCKRCKSVTFPHSHICLTCGDIIVQHSIQDQWTDNHAMKRKFAQVMYIPEAKASHHNPLQPSAPGQVVPTAVGLQEASRLAVPLSPMRGDEPPVVVATSLDPSEPSISLLPTTMPDMPMSSRSTPSTVKLTDFDLSVFGEIEPSKQNNSTSSSTTDFDSFLLGFDSASMTQNDSEMASIASINEKIEQQSRKKKQSVRRGASEDTVAAELDSSQPSDSKKLLEIMNRIPDLTFMSSKTLVVPASNYSFALSAQASK